MPFKDPAARAAYMQRYWDDYLSRPDAAGGTKAEAARRRKAEWAAKNKTRLTAKKRQQRRAKATAERLGLAIEIVSSGQPLRIAAPTRAVRSRNKSAA